MVAHQSPAQDALSTAVEGDRLYAARQAAAAVARRPDEMHWGPVYFQATLSYSMEWNDNVNNAPDAQESDWILRPQLNLGVSWQVSETSRLTFGIGVGYQKYLDHPDLDRMVLTPDSELAWDIKLQDVVITLYDRAEYSQDVISQGGLSGTAEFPRIENTAGVRARWYPGRYVYELGYGHYNFFSQSTDYNYLTRSAEQFFGRAGLRVGETSQMGIEASGALTDYDSPTRADNNNYSIGPYLNWQLIEELNLNLRGGYTKYATDFDPFTGLSSEFDSYYLGLDLNHQLTDYIRHGLTVSRDVQQGVNQGSSLTETLNVRYAASWAMTDHVSLSGNVFYEHAKEPQFGFEEIYDRVGFGAGLRWQATEHAAAGLNYSFTTKDSNLDSRDYQVNSVILTASYRF